MPASNTVSDRAEKIIDEFALFDDWMNRYQYLIEMGDDIPLLPDEEKSDEHYVHGCQSDVWIRARYDEDDQVLRFEGDSNARITKGLAALIIRVVDAQPPEAVAEADFDFLDEIGLHEHLSSQRNNGLEAMIDQMKKRAGTFQN